ncbi:RHS repeat domain-containing protein [Chitinophaga pinensis]|nr:RHS repeat domain-containing protein [Chitinophaga pinensis]
MRSLFFTAAFMLFEVSCADLFAQTVTPPSTTLGKIVSASPEAASIALYQNYPVDYVSGAPDITIPLFDVPTRAGTLPFQLSYHIGKLKPNEQPGGPGWGWTLTPNLGITRSVKGIMDGVNAGYPANSQFGQNTEAYLLGASLYSYDEQPDDFYYSLLSKSGQFVYNRSGAFRPVSFDAVKISHPDDNTFQITDDDGTIYKFGKYSSGTSVVTEFSGGGSPTTLSAWKITEIIPYDKSDTIRFNYNPRTTYTMPYYNIQWQFIEYVGANSIPGGVGKPVNIYQNVYNVADGIPTGASVLRPSGVTTGNYYVNEPLDLLPQFAIGESEYKIRLSGSHVGTQREQAAWAGLDYGSDHVANVMSDVQTQELPLSEIRFKGGRVSFYYTENNQLTNIFLYAGSQLVKRASLFQHALQHASYEQPFSYYDNLNTRYGLDSVKVYGSDMTSPVVYRMEYSKQNDEECVGVYGNYNTDFWGFVNNKRAYVIPHLMYYVANFVWNTLLENPDPANLYGSPKNAGGWVEVGSQQEQTSPTRMVPGIIKRLYYPTGGYAEFDFESNQYASSIDYTKTIYGGGYRVKQIKYTTGDRRDSITKVYRYGLDENGIGKTKYKNYTANFISVQYVNSTMSGQSDNYLQRIATVNSKPFLDMSFSSGAAVLYPYVTEYTVNPVNNQTLGKTVYEYVIDSKNDMWVNMTPLHSDPKDDWKIISLVSVTNYRYRNGRYNILSRTQNKYMDYYTDTIPAAQTFLNYYNNAASGGLDVIAGNPPQVGAKFSHISYNIYCGSHKLTEINDTTFDAEDSTRYMASQTAISYDPIYLYRNREVKNDSRNIQKRTEYFYPHQAGQISDLIVGQLPILNALTSSNVLRKPIATKEYSDTILLRTIQQSYVQYPNSKIFPSAVYTSTRRNPLEKRVEFSLYDNDGNILEQRKADDVKDVYLWGYKSQYPVAKVTGSTYDIVKTFVSLSLLDSAQSYTDVRVREELNKIRTGLAGTVAKVCTYTYKPMVGMTSETDANGKTIYYEYDVLGRLIVVRDQDGNILKQMEYQYQVPITK